MTTGKLPSISISPLAILGGTSTDILGNIMMGSNNSILSNILTATIITTL
jgi:hypothetical protein